MLCQKPFINNSAPRLYAFISRHCCACPPHWSSPNIADVQYHIPANYARFVIVVSFMPYCRLPLHHSSLLTPISSPSSRRRWLCHHYHNASSSWLGRHAHSRQPPERPLISTGHSIRCCDYCLPTTVINIIVIVSILPFHAISRQYFTKFSFQFTIICPSSPSVVCPALSCRSVISLSLITRYHLYHSPTGFINTTATPLFTSAFTPSLVVISCHRSSPTPATSMPAKNTAHHCRWEANNTTRAWSVTGSHCFPFTITRQVTVIVFTIAVWSPRTTNRVIVAQSFGWLPSPILPPTSFSRNAHHQFIASVWYHYYFHGWLNGQYY